MKPIKVCVGAQIAVKQEENIIVWHQCGETYLQRLNVLLSPVVFLSKSLERLFACIHAADSRPGCELDQGT